MCCHSPLLDSEFYRSLLTCSEKTSPRSMTDNMSALVQRAHQTNGVKRYAKQAHLFPNLMQSVNTDQQFWHEKGKVCHASSAPSLPIGFAGWSLRLDTNAGKAFYVNHEDLYAETSPIIGQQGNMWNSLGPLVVENQPSMSSTQLAVIFGVIIMYKVISSSLF